MKRPSGGLNVVFQLLRPCIAMVLVSDRLRPDASGYPPDHRKLSAGAVGKEKGEIRGELVDIHPAGEVVFNIGKPVGQG